MARHLTDDERHAILCIRDLERSDGGPARVPYGSAVDLASVCGVFLTDLITAGFVRVTHPGREIRLTRAGAIIAEALDG